MNLSEHYGRPPREAGTQADIHIVFDGPPSHESGRFVEVETPDGKSISVGRWEQRGEYWHFIIPSPTTWLEEHVHLCGHGFIGTTCGLCMRDRGK